MLQMFRRRWFLLSLAALIPSGLAVGANASEETVEQLFNVFRPRVITAIVLFLMAFSLDSRQLGASLRSPGPVLWAALVNYGLIPLMAWPLMRVQTSPDFALGLMIAAAVPSTMAAASVWTRKAGGNDAVSLLVTIATNGLCFVLTPMWLKITTARSIELDVWQMLARLVTAVLVPMIAGQLVRQVPAAGHVARRFKQPIGVAAQACILTLVFTAACRGGVQLNSAGATPGAGGVALVWATCIGVHLAAMLAGVVAGRLFGFRRGDWIAVAFSSSQKTLPIGLLVATDPTMFGNPDLLGPGVGVPFAVFPMLMYHASQLFIDTAVADRLRAGGDRDLEPQNAGSEIPPTV